MAITGSPSMSYNASNRRLRTKVQQEYTNRKVDSLYIDVNLARLSLVNNSGITWADVPFTEDNGGSGFANIFTDSSGNRYPVPSTLSVNKSNWQIVNNGTGLKYTGDAKIVQLYASVVVRPSASNNSINNITIDNAGSGYTSAPNVSFSGGGGTGAAAIAVINPNTNMVDDIIITHGGSGYTSAPTITISGGGGMNAAATATISDSTVLTLSVYKNEEAVDSNTNAKLICDPALQFTTSGEISVVTTLQKGDVIRLMTQNESSRELSYKFYGINLAVRPVEMVGV